MDKLYDTDIREIIAVVDAKRKKEYEDKHGHEMPEELPMTNELQKPTVLKPEDQSTLGTDDLDEISSIDSDTKEEEKKFKVHDGVLGGTQNVMNTAVSDLIQHAKCYTFEYKDCDYDRFHRPELTDTFYELEYEKKKDQSKPYLTVEQKLNMSKIGSLQEFQRNEEDKILSLRMVLQSNTKLKKKLKKTGIINANDYFKDRYKLSLKSGKFLVFENIDENPLFINDFGMASKLYRYIYSDNILPLKFFKKQPAGMAQTRHIGYYGQQVLLSDEDKLPLIGQIDRKKYQGLTVLENNLYRVPACYHKPKKSDFLCIVHKTRNDERLMYIREMKQIYTLGQQEPKEEVYSPQSRPYGAFLKRRVQAFALKILENCNNRINFNELRKFFTIFNDQVLRKTLKEIDVEVDRNQDAFLALDESIEDKIKNLISPENICQYESAEFGSHRLNKLGIRRITNSNKVSFAANKFCSEEKNPKYKKYAKIIEEEILCTPWNLSQSFITNMQSNGMMILKDIGDPSNGHGGYSFLKLPLKMSQDTLNKEAVPAKSVTGTEADLRKLSKDQIHDMLRKLGYDKHLDINSLCRWEGVKILRDKSSKAASLGIAGGFKKFARGVRMTSKMQRENYQKQINDIFDQQLNTLISPKPEIPSDSEYEAPSKEEKALKNMPWEELDSTPKKKTNEAGTSNRDALYDENSLNDMKTYLEAKEENEINSIYDLPGYNNNFRNHMKEYYDKFKENSHECVVLKKVIKDIDPRTGEDIQRVVYIFDERHIKSFKKRVEKCKSRRRTKSKKTRDRTYYGTNRSRAGGDALVSLRVPDMSDYDQSSMRSGHYADRRAPASTKNKTVVPDTITINLGGDDQEDEDIGKIVLDTSDNRTPKKSHSQSGAKKSKKPKPKAPEVNQYLKGPVRQNTGSRRRQNTPLSQMNEILCNIVDACITFDNTGMFHQPVKKKDAESYYDIIKNPMDLFTIKSKAKRCDYTHISQFEEDLKLLRTNSELYNGPNHFVTNQAVSILERADLLLQADGDQLKELEQKVADGNQF